MADSPSLRHSSPAVCRPNSPLHWVSLTTRGLRIPSEMVLLTVARFRTQFRQHLSPTSSRKQAHPRAAFPVSRPDLCLLPSHRLLHSDASACYDDAAIMSDTSCLLVLRFRS